MKITQMNDEERLFKELTLSFCYITLIIIIIIIIISSIILKVSWWKSQVILINLDKWWWKQKADWKKSQHFENKLVTPKQIQQQSERFKLRWSLIWKTNYKAWFHWLVWLNVKPQRKPQKVERLKVEKCFYFVGC